MRYNEPTMNKINKVLLSVVIVLILAIAGFIGWKWFFASDSMSAVYLKTGDLYFGKIVRFPSYGLKEVYLLQVNQQNQENPLSVQRFKNIFWGPEDFIKINPDEIVWTSDLRDDSQLAQLIAANPDLVAPQGQEPVTEGTSTVEQ